MMHFTETGSRKLVARGWGEGAGGVVPIFCLEAMKKFCRWMVGTAAPHVNELEDTALYPSTWFSWSIVCYVSVGSDGIGLRCGLDTADFFF